jgi:hypothetical protein
MKKKVFFVFMLLSATIFGFTTDNEGKTLLNHEEIIVTTIDYSSSDFFKKTSFNSAKGDISFNTKTKVEELIVLDGKEELTYILPIKTQKIIIGKSLFDPGNYDLIFKVSDKLTYQLELQVLEK